MPARQTTKSSSPKRAATKKTAQSSVKAAGNTTSKKTPTKTPAATKLTVKKSPIKKTAAKKSPAKRSTTTSGTKPAARSLHIGLNSVSPKQYAGWEGELFACERDATDMAKLATQRGMQATTLLTRAATREAVLKELQNAAATLKTGDYFVLSYSGHGGQVPDITGEEADKKDETWCLYNGQLIDDELYLELGKFKAGVRLFVLSDSCHSGTVVRAAPPEMGDNHPLGRARMMPPSVADATYAQHKKQYDTLQLDVARKAKGKQVDPDAALAHVAVSARLGEIVADFKASLILISGCQDNQTSRDGAVNGAFTGQLLRVWHGGAFTGNYKRFHAEIQRSLPSDQSPNLFTLGPVADYVLQAPFQLAGGAAKVVTKDTAKAFINGVELPRPRVMRGAKEGPTSNIVFDAAKTQAAVVGSDVVSFVTGVTVERREAIVNSSLLAQLVAKNKVPDPSRLDDWYNAYFETLTNVGWVIQDRQFAEYKEQSNIFETHKAIMAVLTTILGPAPAALAIVTATLDALHSMNEGSPWITLFNRETQSAETARFQISLAEESADGHFMVTLMAFALRAEDKVTQVLFFKAKSSKVSLRHYSGSVTINTTVLDAVSEQIKAKVIAQASNFVQGLPDFT